MSLTSEKLGRGHVPSLSWQTRKPLHSLSPSSSRFEYPPRNHERMQIKAVCGVCLEPRPISQVARVRDGYVCIPCKGRRK